MLYVFLNALHLLPYLTFIIILGTIVFHILQVAACKELVCDRTNFRTQLTYSRVVQITTELY